MKIKMSELKKKGGGWGSLPHGWTNQSLDKWWDSIGGSVSACMSKVKGHVSDPGAFCASAKDKVTGKTTWRGKE